MLYSILYVTLRVDPSAEHIVHFDHYPTSLLWYSSEIMYTPLRITFILQTSFSTEIDPFSIAFSATWHIPHAIEEYSHHQFVLIWYQSQYIISAVYSRLPISRDNCPLY